MYLANLKFQLSVLNNKYMYYTIIYLQIMQMAYFIISHLPISFIKPFCIYYSHLHSSMHTDIVPLHKSLDKSSYKKLGFYLIGSRGIIWNRLQTISHCVNKTQPSLNCISTELVLIGGQTIQILRHEQHQANRITSPSFVARKKAR